MSELPAPKTATTLRIPPRVLLVGRSYKDAPTLMQLLITEGYLVISEMELTGALSKLRSAKFHFVVVDIDVSGAPGQTFIETLRGDEKLAGMPVLVMSKSDDMESIERFLECGADDYLPSMFGPSVLRLRV